jgi:hypothetical protein
LDLLNLAITTNARGGPGIVLASVGFDAGIISQSSTRHLCSLPSPLPQAAGVWLDYVLRKGWPLLAPIATNPSALAPRRRKVRPASTQATTFCRRLLA